MDILVAKRRGGYLQPTIGDEHLEIIKSLVEEKNDLLLSELCDCLKERTDISVSVTTMPKRGTTIRPTP